MCPFCARLAVRKDCLALLLCARGAALPRLSSAPHIDAWWPTGPALHAFCCLIAARCGRRRPCHACTPCRSAMEAARSWRSSRVRGVSRRSRLLLSTTAQTCRAWLFLTWTRACGCQRCTSLTTRPASGTKKRQACAQASRCANSPLLSPSYASSHRCLPPPGCPPVSGSAPRVQGAGRGAAAAQNKGCSCLQHHKAIVCRCCDASLPLA